MYFAPEILVIAVLLFWGALGWTVVRMLAVKCDRARLLLISPLAGLCVVVISVLWLNVAGLPVATFARPLTAGLAILAAIGAIRWSPAYPLSRTKVILAIAVLSLVVCGIPTFLYGFDWIANSNDDWANYNLEAVRVLNAGFFATPDAQAMLRGEDYPGYFWFFHVGTGVRDGSELLIAWLAGLLGWNPFFIFMPLILACQGALLLSATALASRFLTRRHVLTGGLALTAFSPLGFYAVQQQLIAQVMGLTFLTGLATVALVPLHRLAHIGTAMVTGILAAGMLLVYPEIVPFFGITFLSYQGARFFLKRDSLRVRYLLPSFLVVTATVLLLNGPFALSALSFMLRQAQSSANIGAVQGISRFPWFVIPSGLGTLWGFIPLGDIPSDGWASIWIIAGFGLTAVAIFMTVQGVRRADPASCLGLTMFLVGLYLIFTGGSFGLFKLAMFSGAIIWFLAARFFAIFIRSRIIYALFVAILLSCMIPAEQAGIARSEGGGAADIPNGSRHLLSQALAPDASMPDLCKVDFDTALAPLIKILAARPGCQRFFIGRDIFTYFVDGAYKGAIAGKNATIFDEQARIVSLRSALAQNVTELDFPTEKNSLVRAVISTPPPVAGALGLVPDRRAIFNLSRTDRIEAGPAGAFSNRLIFVHSDLGNHYYARRTSDVAFYQSEDDPIFPNLPVAAVGRYLLFRVNAPSSRVRLSLWITVSYLRDREAFLPPAAISGEEYVSLGMSGRGSARVVSDPLLPLNVAGINYLLLDLGADARILPVPRQGLMALYGRNVPVDTRRITAYARRIRLIDDATYDPADTLDAIRSFPASLADPRLNYEGIFEDGWVGSRARVTLASRGLRHLLVVHGMIPGGIGFGKQHVLLRANGRTLVEKDIEPGDFDIEAPVDVGVQDIALEFTDERRLPHGDGRPVSALLRSVAIE